MYSHIHLSIDPRFITFIYNVYNATSYHISLELHKFCVCTIINYTSINNQMCWLRHKV